MREGMIDLTLGRVSKEVKIGPRRHRRNALKYFIRM